MASDKVRLALIGAGGMATKAHYPSLAEFEDVELVGLCDINTERLQKAADSLEIEGRYTNYREMVEATAPDAVFAILQPPHVHEVANWILEQKLHVFVEKPPGLTSYQTRMLADVAERNGCLTMCGFNRRFSPLMQHCRNAIIERGGMTQCVSTFYKNHVGQPPYNAGAIDILYVDAIHCVDTLRWMGGEVTCVISDIKRHGRSFETAWTALTQHEEGCVGVLLTNWMVGFRVHTFEMHGIGISAFVDPGTGAVIHADNKPNVEELDAKELAGGDDTRIFQGFKAEDRHFIDCIKSGQQPETCFADGVKTMELADRIYCNQL